MKTVIATLLAVIATALVVIVINLIYSAHRHSRMQAYLDCFSAWNMNPADRTLKQACGEEP